MSDGPRRRSPAVPLAVVGVVAAAYLLGREEGQETASETETAYCVNQEDEIVEERFCGDEDSGGGAGFFWIFGGYAGALPRRGALVSGGTRIPSLNKGALAQRGGLGSSARGPGGVGRSVPVRGGGG